MGKPGVLLSTGSDTTEVMNKNHRERPGRMDWAEGPRG